MHMSYSHVKSLCPQKYERYYYKIFVWLITVSVFF